jgi:transposase
MENKITMSQKEFRRLPIITKVLENKLSQKDAAKILNLSTKQVYRIIKNSKFLPLENVLIHKNRGNTSKRKISPELEQKIKELYEIKYYDFGPTFFCEKLFENHDIKLSKESLRKILIKFDLWQTRKIKKSSCHIWRQRKEHFGELVQFDGSHHRWLENRLEEEFCLMVFIDDATGEKFARFYDYEGTFPAIDCLNRFVKKYGIPKALYCDRHSTYFTDREQNLDEQLANEFPKTKFGNFAKKLNIELIHARSPQAKGRVERANAIFQDRLVKELRLENIKTIDDANDYLETFFLQKMNKKFTVLAKSEISFFKALNHDIKIDEISNIETQRTICNDFTIQWQNRRFLMLNRQPKMRNKKIIIQQFPNGSLKFFTKNFEVKVKEITKNFNQKIVNF